MAFAARPVAAFIVAAGLSLALNSTARASNWVECHFEVLVVDVSDTHVTVEPRRFVRGDGSGAMDERSCRRMLGDGPVPIEQVAEGTRLLVPGARLHGRWSRYGGMSPSGPVSFSGWSFAPLDHS